jgi:L-alanine-DL-glutamate epimerase-like enolase superfamily enzyme
MTPTITGVDAVGHRIPMAEDFPVTYESHDDTEHVFVRLRTDDGTVGYGEGTALPWFTGESTEDMAAVVARWLAPQVEGKPLDEAVADFEAFRKRFPANPGAKAAVDLALWDLRGKRADLPVSELLGERLRDEVPVVHTIPGLDPEAAAEVAEEKLAEGFTRFKVKATGDADADVARIERVLSVLPEEATARVDANTGWKDFPTARRILDRIERTDQIEYLEQPVAADRLADLRSVWTETGVPVYADEAVHGPGDVERIGADRLAAGCHFKLAKTGGLREEAHMAALADRHDLAVTVVSAFGTSLNVAANLHLAATVPTLSSGCELGAVFLADDPTTPRLGREPWMAVPTGPGLGVELRESLFE